MQQGNFIDVFLARYVSGTYAHHQEHWMLSCSIRFSAPSFWMGCGFESRCVGSVYGADVAIRFSAPSFWMACDLQIRCVGRVYGADGAVRHHPHRTHYLHSCSQDHHPSKNSVQKTICCNSTSNAPDDERMYPKHVKLRIY